VKTFAAEKLDWRDDKEYIADMNRRLDELESGKVKGYTLDEMEAVARQAFTYGMKVSRGDWVATINLKLASLRKYYVFLVESGQFPVNTAPGICPLRPARSSTWTGICTKSDLSAPQVE
jgi:site-specific recombinase XerC